MVKRLPPPDSGTPACSKMAIDRLIARRDVHRREKTLWRMLYETVARAEEILGVNIEELDLADHWASVKAKGADHVRAAVVSARGVRDGARVLGRRHRPPAAPLIKAAPAGRCSLPAAPGPGNVVSPRGVCLESGLARLSGATSTHRRRRIAEVTSLLAPGDSRR
ncbi:hypothetical protein [Streptomyces mirabilis]|uniref:hypothetical protein n=1 Tax=Streptomyces mirabilis TaxID=68239 RepID=UPI0036A65A79